MHILIKCFVIYSTWAIYGIQIKPLKIKRASRPSVGLWRPIGWVATHRLGTTDPPSKNLTPTKLQNLTALIRPKRETVTIVKHQLSDGLQCKQRTKIKRRHSLKNPQLK